MWVTWVGYCRPFCCWLGVEVGRDDGVEKRMDLGVEDGVDRRIGERVGA